MIFVFTAVVLFFTFLFWNIDRLNRMAKHEHNVSAAEND